jgi:hypothetical protein
MKSKKKKDELSDQLAVYFERQSPRYMLDAGISIEGFEGEGQLGNVSVSGCCMASVTYAAITPGEVYNVKILPGVQDKLKPFNLKLKVNWTKSSEEVFYAGFSLENNSPNKNQMRRYTEILHARGIPPDYGNMNPASLK